MRQRAEDGHEVPALDRKPYLEDQPDAEKLLSDFMMLSQTRQPGFNGPGTLRMMDIAMLYQAEGWAEADVELIDYVRTMLFLDSALHQYHDERKPRGK